MTKRQQRAQPKQQVDVEAPGDAWPASMGSGLPHPDARRNGTRPHPDASGVSLQLFQQPQDAQEPGLNAQEAVPYLNPQTGMPRDDACEAVPYLCAQTGRPIHETKPVEEAPPTTTRSPPSPAVPYLSPEVQRVSAAALPYLHPQDALPYFEAVQSQEAASMQQFPSLRAPTGMDAGLQAKLARQQNKEELGESSVDPLSSRPTSERRSVVDGRLAAKFAEQQEREQSGGECRIEAGLAPRAVSPRAMEPQLATRLERQRRLLEAPEGGAD